MAPRRKTVTQAAANGSTRDLLVAMRDRVAKAVEDDTTRPGDLASLTRRLIDIAHEIEEIDAREAERQQDEIKKADNGDVPLDVSAL